MNIISLASKYMRDLCWQKRWQVMGERNEADRKAGGERDVMLQ